MRRTLLSLIGLVFCITTFAQSSHNLEFTNKKQVLLDNIVLTKKTSLNDLKKILGEPEVYKEYPTGKTNYHFKEHGIAAHMVNGQLLYIGVNLNWDGDKIFPETPYTGHLKIDGVSIDSTTTNEIVEQVKNVEITCPMPDMCMTNPHEESTPIMIGFMDNKITQVGFEFH